MKPSIKSIYYKVIKIDTSILRESKCFSFPFKKYIFLNNLHIFHTNWNKNFTKLCDFVGVSGNNSISNGIVIDIGGGNSEFVTFEKIMW